MLLITDRNALYWTPNTIKAEVTIKGEEATIKLHSNTPNLVNYQMKDDAVGVWRDISNPFTISLKNGRNEMLFRSMNRAGVPGIGYQVVIE